jgi:hypothetical protein
MAKRFCTLAASIMALSASAIAAPIGSDWGNRVVDAVNALVTTKGNVLEHDGLILLTWIGIFKLLMMIIPMLLRRLDILGHAGWHTTVHFSEILILLFQISLCSLVLHHYTEPFPGTSLSVHQVPTVLAKNLVTEFDAASIDQFMGYLTTAAQKLDTPSGPLAILEVTVYIFILSNLGLLAAGMFVITSFGYVGTGLMVVVGPLFIPLALTKRFYGWFWNWLQLIFAFAMYRVMATVIGWVWAQVYIGFFVNDLNIDHVTVIRIASCIAFLPVVIMLSLGFLFSMFCIPKITAMLFGGAGSIGQDYVAAGWSKLRAAIS